MQKKRRRPWFRAPRSGDRDSLLGGVVARWVPIIKEPTFPFEVSARGWVWCQLSFYAGFGGCGECASPQLRAEETQTLRQLLCTFFAWTSVQTKQRVPEPATTLVRHYGGNALDPFL